MRCSACENGDCYEDYDYRSKCVGRKEHVNCACKCRITKTADVVTKTLSVAGGVACIGGGIFFPGLVPGVKGGLIGAGASLVSKPFRKDMAGEHLEFEDSLTEAVAFGVTGAGLGARFGALNAAKTVAETSTALGVIGGAAGAFKCFDVVLSKGHS